MGLLVSADNNIVANNLNFPVYEWFPLQTQARVGPRSSSMENFALKNCKNFNYF